MMKLRVPPASLLFLISLWDLAAVHSQAHTAPYVTFRGNFLQNHSYIDFSQVGSDRDDGVHCHSDLSTCCHGSYGQHRGNWYLPTGGVLSSGGFVHQNNFLPSRISVYQISRVNVVSGLYRCSIDTNTSIHSGVNDTVPGPRETVYVGLYYDSGGDLSLQYGRDMRISVHSVDPPRFTLTFTSTGGPATTVTWSRDSETIEGGTTALQSTRYSTYTHTLNASEAGVYQCTVWNNKPSTLTAELNVTAAPSPPSNLRVSQNGLDSVLVSWIPSPDGAEAYIIYYQLEGGERASMRADGSDTSITISDLVGGGTYSFSMIATNTLPSSIEIGPFNITIDSLTVSVSVSDSYVYAGELVTFTCSVTLLGTLTGTPLFSWQGPGDTLLPSAPPTTSGQVVSSVLTLSNIRTSQAGQYSCTAGLAGFAYPVQSPQIALYVTAPTPRTSVTTSHTAPFYAGTGLTLMCNISTHPAVDTPIIERVQWVVDGRRLYNPVSTDRRTFSEQQIIFYPLDTSDGISYRCDVRLIGRSYYTSTYSRTLDMEVKALPAPEVNLTAASVVTVGTSVSLECSVSVVPHLITAPHAELLGPGGFVLASGTNLSLAHTLDPVRASNAGQYVCISALDIESVDVSLSSQSAIHTLTVQLPQPSMNAYSDPPGPLSIGSPVTLTCWVTFHSAVDTLGSVSFLWGGPRVTSGEPYTVGESGSGLQYVSRLSVPSLEERDEGAYVCSVRVAGGRNILGITSSASTFISVLDAVDSSSPSSSSAASVGGVITGVITGVFTAAVLFFLKY